MFFKITTTTPSRRPAVPSRSLEGKPGLPDLQAVCDMPQALCFLGKAHVADLKVG